MCDLLDFPVVTRAAAARHIAVLLGGEGVIRRRDLNEAITATFGGTGADGYWTLGDRFEMLEHAFALHPSSRRYPLGSPSDLAALSRRVERCLRQRVRSCRRPPLPPQPSRYRPSSAASAMTPTRGSASIVQYPAQSVGRADPPATSPDCVLPLSSRTTALSVMRRKAR